MIKVHNNIRLKENRVITKSTPQPHISKTNEFISNARRGGGLWGKTWLCISLRAVAAVVSEVNRTNPYPFDFPDTWSHITLTAQKHGLVCNITNLGIQIIRKKLAHFTFDDFPMLPKGVSQDSFIRIVGKPFVPNKTKTNC